VRQARTSKKGDAYACDPRVSRRAGSMPSRRAVSSRHRRRALRRGPFACAFPGQQAVAAEWSPPPHPRASPSCDDGVSDSGSRTTAVLAQMPAGQLCGWWRRNRSSSDGTSEARGRRDASKGTRSTSLPGATVLEYSSSYAGRRPAVPMRRPRPLRARASDGLKTTKIAHR